MIGSPKIRQPTARSTCCFNIEPRLGVSWQDFNNDQVDAGNIGSGHTVTAIYEITPAGAPAFVDDLRSAKSVSERSDAPQTSSGSPDSEFGFLKLRYKKSNSETSELISLPNAVGLEKPTTNDVPQDVRFSVTVAAFGDLSRGAPYEAKYSFDDVISLAQTSARRRPVRVPRRVRESGETGEIRPAVGLGRLREERWAAGPTAPLFF